MTSCPVCHSNSKVLFTKNSYQINACMSCGHRYADLVPSPGHVANCYSDEYFFGGEAGYPDYLTEKESLIKRGIHYSRILSNYVRKGKVLDVGAAAGFILKGFIDKGWSGKGLEPNLQMVTYARDILGLDMQNDTFEEYEPNGESFDAVLMIQAIGHFYDLNVIRKKICQVVKPGGFVLIETWNCKSLMAKFLGPHWHEYSPPTVLNYFSKKSLDLFVTSNGFRKIRSRNTIKKISGIHARSLLKYKYVVKPDGIRSRIIDLIPGKVFLPYISDDLFWTLYNKT